MSTLYLVRHGQASFGKEDYDQLSDLGYEQARVTGDYLAKITKPTLFISGTLKRQRQTLTQVKLGFSDKLLEKAEHLELPSFNEFDHRNILEVVYPNLRVSHKTLLENLLTSDSAVEEFQLLYKAAIDKWVDNDGDFKETFEVFSNRISTGFNKLLTLSASKNQNIILVSSAGPISSCMQHGTGLSSKDAFLLCEVMVNAAVSALTFDSGPSARLSYFNNFQHLVYAGSDITYR
jgi:broad specificity phosphatase PhoE